MSSTLCEDIVNEKKGNFLRINTAFFFFSVYRHSYIVSSSAHNLPVEGIISNEQMWKGRLTEAEGR